MILLYINLVLLNFFIYLFACFFCWYEYSCDTCSPGKKKQKHFDVDLMFKVVLFEDYAPEALGN